MAGSLDELCNQSWDLTDTLLSTKHPAKRDDESEVAEFGGAARRQPPLLGGMLMSTIKLRKAGFDGCEDTEDMAVRWMREMQRLRVLPG